MKVDYERIFSPVTVTFESSEELDIFKNALSTYRSTAAKRDNEVRIEMLDLLRINLRE